MRFLAYAITAIAFLGLPIGYLRLCLAMNQAAIQHPPKTHFFFVFGAFGGFLICACPQAVSSARGVFFQW